MIIQLSIWENHCLPCSLELVLHSTDTMHLVASYPVPRPAFRRCLVLSSDEKLGVGLGTRLCIRLVYYLALDRELDCPLALKPIMHGKVVSKCYFETHMHAAV